MTWLVLFATGLLLGTGAERLVGRRDRAGAAPAGTADGRPLRRRRRRRVAVGVALVTLVVLVALPLAGLVYANSQFRKIERVPVGSVLEGGRQPGTNYLLVGTDNRQGVAGNRSDTMMVLRIAGGSSTLLSLPRDLYVTIPGRDSRDRLNAAYNQGPDTLVRTVQQSLGIPIDRYVEINFVSFGGLVDALGGVTIDFPYPASDPKSGLDVRQSGPVRLNGEQALAYVRSRTYTEVIGGRTRVDGTADLGRVKRQQAFMRAVMSEAGKSRSPWRMAKIGRALTRGLRIDDGMSLVDALRFAWAMGRLRPESVTLPTTPDRTAGGADVLLLRQPDADAVLAPFRS
ncbi:MAG: LCP family protein [Actinobacteria bacterium]|nr:LCP family protein [Actinomycetota bacterium]